MNKLILVILILILLTSCTPEPIQPLCNTPYIIEGISCCLDQNYNQICDSDEKTNEVLPEIKNEALITETFTVARVINGDTILLNNGQKVRLICIDTPETNEPYYQEAKNELERLILNKEIQLEKDISETDRYGRLLRYVYLDNLSVNIALVENGFAKAYRYPPDIKYCDIIESAEEKAKHQVIGIWQIKVEKPITQNVFLPQQNITTSETVCSRNAYNCGDFSSHSEAQSVFEACGGMSNDIHRLDQDKDGIACESLP